MENIGDVDWEIVARIVHVLAVVVWVGGVWFVTAVVLRPVEILQIPPHL